LKTFTFITTFLLSISCFANSLQDLAGIAANPTVKEIVKIAEVENFGAMSITSSRLKSGAGNKGFCQIYVLKLRHKDVFAVAKGDSYQERQQSAEALDVDVDLCVASVDGKYSVTLMNYALDGQLYRDLLIVRLKARAGIIAKP
jgi:hypothetical protein